jgi:hypothetical protein
MIFNNLHNYWGHIYGVDIQYFKYQLNHLSVKVNCVEHSRNGILRQKGQ